MAKNFEFRARGLARFSALLTASTALTGIAAVPPAAAQTQERFLTDENGVDPVTGHYRLALPIADVGGDSNRLSLVVLGESLDNWTQFFATEATGGGVTYITVGFGTERDYFVSSNGYASSTLGTGAKLTVNSNGTVTYTRASGQKLIYNDPAAGTGPSCTGPWNACTLYGSKIVNEDQSEITVTQQVEELCHWEDAPPYDGIIDFNDNYVCANVFRIASVQNSDGYYINFSYESNDASSDPVGYTRRTGATLGNSKVSGGTRSLSFSSSYSSITDPLSGSWALTFSSGALTGLRRPGESSNSLAVSYGSGGIVSSVTKDGVTTNYSRSLSGSTATLTKTDALSNATTIVSNTSIYQVTSVTDPLGRTTSFSHDSAGRVTAVTNDEGDKTEFAYDGRGNVTSTTRVAKSGSGLSSIVTSATYPSSCTNDLTCNKPTTTTDERGNVTDYSYSTSHGGVLAVTSPAATSGGTRPETRYSYSLVNGGYKLTGISACQTGGSCAGTSDETKTVLSYDTNGNVATVEQAAGNGSLSATSTIAHDAVGNVTNVDGPLSGSADTTTFRYDALRRRTGAISPDPDGSGSLPRRAQRTSFDAAGRVTSQERGTVNGVSDTDWAAFSSSQGTTYAYSNNRVAKAEVASGSTTYAVTQYSYDTVGRLDCTAVRMNPSTFGSLPAACTAATAGSHGPDRIVRNGYDAAGQLTSVIEGYGQSEQATERALTYTDNGKVQTATDAEGNKTSYEYDGHDRLARIVYPSGTKGAGTSNSSDYEQLGYDAASNVTSRRLRDGATIGFSYDALNRLSGKDLPSPEYDTTFSYDLLSRLTGMSRGDGQSLSFSYDALGRNVSASGTYGGTTSYQYDLAGRRTRMTWSDSFYVDYDYLVTGEMSAIRENGATSGVGVLATFSYDSLGRRTGITRGNGTSTSYGYDAVSRLSSLSQDLSGSTYDFSHSFAYNPGGQIVTVTRSNDAYAYGGHVNVDRNYSSNGLNQYTASGGTSLGYDSRGNLTSSGSSSYGYTIENLLKSAPGSVTLDYDPGGRLIRTAGSAETRFAYDGQDLIAEYDSSNGMLRRYVHGPDADEPILWYEGSGTSDRRWLHADERGSVVAVTDGSGAMMSGGLYRYDEFGIPGGSHAGRFQYTGQAWIPEIGMYHYKARTYSPTLGRFLQTDPIGYADGLNLYAYVKNDPVNFADPSGLNCEEVKAHAALDEIVVCRSRGGASTAAASPVETIVVTGARLFNSAARILDNTSDRASSNQESRAGPSQQKEEPKPAPKPKPKYNARVNYCGGEGGARFPNQGINQACFNHDVCYNGSGTPRSTCDAIFAGEIYLRRFLLNFPSSLAPADAALWSLIYGSAVALRGWQYYVPKK